MTKTNLPEKLRRVINLRNLLIISFLLLTISPVFAYDNDVYIDTYISTVSGNKVYFSGLDDVTNLYEIEFVPYSTGIDLDGGGTNINVYEDSGDTVIATVDVTLTGSDANNNGAILSFDYWTPGMVSAGEYVYLAQYSVTYDGGASGGAKYGSASTGGTDGAFGACCGWKPLMGHYYVTYDAPPAYAVNVSGTGTFCYSYPIDFNVSLDEYTDEYAFYYLVFYKDGDPVSYYTAFDGNEDGFYSFSKSLPPGDYASEGIIQFEEYELEGWLNFTVIDDCSMAFSGTINDTNPYTYSSNHTWEWTYYDYLNNLTPWEAPTMDHGNGTSYIDYMFSLGYINESEYDFIYQRYMDIINQSNNSTATGNEYVFGILTPLEMINDGIITVRSNINGSVSFLSDGISPITSIFGWIIQMMPSWVINLFSIVLAFDATRIILSGRK